MLLRGTARNWLTVIRLKWLSRLNQRGLALSAKKPYCCFTSVLNLTRKEVVALWNKLSLRSWYASALCCLFCAFLCCPLLDFLFFLVRGSGRRSRARAGLLMSAGCLLCSCSCFSCLFCCSSLERFSCWSPCCRGRSPSFCWRLLWRNSWAMCRKSGDCLSSSLSDCFVRRLICATCPDHSFCWRACGFLCPPKSFSEEGL